jgi:hypothetical protein
MFIIERRLTSCQNETFNLWLPSHFLDMFGLNENPFMGDQLRYPVLCHHTVVSTLTDILSRSRREGLVQNVEPSMTPQ